jgi:hypothetical protein
MSTSNSPIAEPPKPVEQTPCPRCAGGGWIEHFIDDRGLGHGDRCVFCGGRGFIWTEVDRVH